MSETAIIPNQPHSNHKIISHLRGILSDLHYSTKECLSCQWIDHRDEQWFRCDGCDEPICNNCYLKHGNSAKRIYHTDCQGQCVSCGLIGTRDNTWLQCDTCDEPICNNCCSECNISSGNIYCKSCQ